LYFLAARGLRFTKKYFLVIAPGGNQNERRSVSSNVEFFIQEKEEFNGKETGK
jgi:hypothetical protein